MLDWFLELRIPGRKNTFSQSYQALSIIDDKIIIALALYQSGLGAKEVSKRMFGGVGYTVQILRRLKSAGVFKSGRKSPIWLGSNTLPDSEQNRRNLIRSFEADQRDWKRGVNRYEKAINPPNWRIDHNRMMASPERRIKFYLRKRLRHCAIDKQHSLKSVELFGCTMTELRAHLESGFADWMTWENYGSHWHIDHEKPCRAFDLTDPEQAKLCFHFTNLRPMEARENILKSDKLPDGTRARHAA